jgi:hypothetical protein
MIAALRNGTIKALLIDAAFVDHYSSLVSTMHYSPCPSSPWLHLAPTPPTSSHQVCDVYQVGPLISPSDFAFALATDTPPSRVEAINLALATLKEQGLNEMVGGIE